MMNFIFGALIGFGAGVLLSIRKGSTFESGTTAWREYLTCYRCKIHYPQYGFNESVYNCPKCGKKTEYTMVRTVDGEFEVKKRG